ncbi:MAG: hypothetical protein MI725_05780, partial [Pirellulales bacterium]|nr:hypothetical protein [Pirellulales bacterium]
EEPLFVHHSIDLAARISHLIRSLPKKKSTPNPDSTGPGVLDNWCLTQIWSGYDWLNRFSGLR